MVTKPHVRDRLKATLNQRDAATSRAGRSSCDAKLVVFVAEMLLFSDERIECALTAIAEKITHIEERLHTMAVDDTKFAADLTQMAADLDEIKAGIATLITNAANNGEAAAQAEADKLTGNLDTAAASLRDAASQFDPSAPPAPDANKKALGNQHGKKYNG